MKLSNYHFACLFIAVATSFGWYWRIAMEQHLIPWWLRVPLGVICVGALVHWLTRRLDRAGAR
ncbi:hypothetical protein [Actinoplanes siamensis]|uniref:Uncharacterized protein n=1 Tax=Actinoplanes siamensis TaxID=1223317 RepID=A0A919NCI3_9ACTN|nr:hypothetical protein [Actinoplanes siamensis]GIF08689.1 hypothetical protein Asi03nite_62270 [Actinoplanes siamensis]